MSIREGIAEYALISAFKDSRFRKIEAKELPLLECGCVLPAPRILPWAAVLTPSLRVSQDFVANRL